MRRNIFILNKPEYTSPSLSSHVVADYEDHRVIYLMDYNFNDALSFKMLGNNFEVKSSENVHPHSD